MYKHSKHSALMARWRVRHRPAPTPEELNPLLRQDGLNLHQQDDNEEEKCHTPSPQKRVKVTDRDDVAPVRLFRGRSPWKPPVPLPPCPFNADSPCCRKGVPCYRYFESDIPGWRRGHLYDSTENDDVTRARLVDHRLENVLPDGKLTVFSSSLTGLVGQRQKYVPVSVCPRSWTNPTDNP